ncbi:alpha-L-fucosidase [Microbacterium sp. KUDC0406]|uniref:alpha-L-fucosidase n=1 Tax=Microbacterium sp. KUDC0406 TaxID=2909588 RepID=UPI003FA58455
MFQQYVRDQLTELLTWYGPIDLLWFDGEWERTPRSGTRRDSHGTSVPSLRRSCSTTVSSASVTTAPPEQYIPPQPLAETWECCMTMGEYWSHVPGDEKYKSTHEILRTLVEVVSKGGNLLLNVGPRADGSLTSEAEVILSALAEWMTDNSEAVHGVEPGLEAWQYYGPTTKRGDRVYLFAPDEPRDAVIVRGIPVRQVASVRLLGDDAPLPFTFRTTLEDIQLYDPSGELRIDVSALPEADTIRVFCVDLDPGLIQGEDRL